jgi:hypothetical protein
MESEERVMESEERVMESEERVGVASHVYAVHSAWWCVMRILGVCAVVV